MIFDVEDSAIFKYTILLYILYDLYNIYYIYFINIYLKDTGKCLLNIFLLWTWDKSIQNSCISSSIMLSVGTSLPT
jgi:hypothetical protein